MLRDDKVCTRCLLDLIEGNSVGNLDKNEALTWRNIEYSKLCDDPVDASLSRKRQGALVQDLVLSLGRVLHGDDDPGSGRNKIHGTAHSLDHLSRDDPVGEIAILSHLQGTEDREIHVPTADHGKGLARVEGR